jgi:myosin heavy subunit
MNPWVIGILGLLIGALPSAYFYMQLSPLQRKLQLAEKGKERSELAYNEAQAELEAKNDEIKAAKSKIPELEAHYRSEIDYLEQSHQSQIEELQQAQAQIPELEAQIEEMKASQVRVRELEAQIAELQASQSASPDPAITDEQLQTLQQQHQAEIQQLQQDNQGQIQALQEQHRAELEERLETHQTQLQEVEQKYQGELKTLESTYQQQILEVQQDFEERLAESESSYDETRADEPLDPHPPSGPVVVLVDTEPFSADSEDTLDPVADLTTPETEAEVFEEEETADLDEMLATTEEDFLEDMADLATMEQVSSVEEDIAGLDAFLTETAEESDPELEMDDSPLPQAEVTEEAIAGLNALLEETEYTEAEETAYILTLDREQTGSFYEDIADLDAFLADTADLEVDDPEEDALLEPFSDDENSAEELEFLTSLQTDSFPLHPEMAEEDQADSLPDLGDLSTPDDDFLNMLQEDASAEDDFPSEPSLSDADNPFADIFGEDEAKKNDHPENGHKQQLDNLDERFNMNLVDHEVPSDR